MSQFALLTFKHLKESIDDEQNTDDSAKEVQEQLEDDEEVRDSASTHSESNPVLGSINNEFEPQCVAETVSLLIAHSIRPSTDYRVPGRMYSNPGLP
jgi:hypothetical protein